MFLYERMCRHGCFEVQINDQGREFVNAVLTCMHDFTGVEQRIMHTIWNQMVLWRGKTER